MPPPPPYHHFAAYFLCHALHKYFRCLRCRITFIPGNVAVVHCGVCGCLLPALPPTYVRFVVPLFLHRTGTVAGQQRPSATTCRPHARGAHSTVSAYGMNRHGAINARMAWRAAYLPYTTRCLQHIQRANPSSLLFSLYVPMWFYLLPSILMVGVCCLVRWDPTDLTSRRIAWHNNNIVKAKKKA